MMSTSDFTYIPIRPPQLDQAANGHDYNLTCSQSCCSKDICECIFHTADPATSKPSTYSAIPQVFEVMELLPHHQDKSITNHLVIWRGAGTVSQAVQPAVHDVTDASALRSWFNPPLAASLAAELYKVGDLAITHSWPKSPVVPCLVCCRVVLCMVAILQRSSSMRLIDQHLSGGQHMWSQRWESAFLMPQYHPSEHTYVNYESGTPCRPAHKQGLG